MVRRVSLGLAVVAALAAAGPAAAADITVTTTADSGAADGRCSLREAISRANTDAPTTVPGECAPGSGPDVSISRPASNPPSRPGAVEDGNLTGDLDVTSVVELRGAGRERTTISAARLDRVIDVTSGAALTVVGITLTGGAAPDGTDSALPGDGASGGGIRTRGALTLQSSAVVGNAAGRGVYTLGPFPGGAGGFGGGIHVFITGSLTVADSVIARNRAGSAGNSSFSAQGLSGGRGGDATGLGQKGGAGGLGGTIGGIYTDELTLTDSLVLGNASGEGRPGGRGHVRRPRRRRRRGVGRERPAGRHPVADHGLHRRARHPGCGRRRRRPGGPAGRRQPSGGRPRRRRHRRADRRALDRRGRVQRPADRRWPEPGHIGELPRRDRRPAGGRRRRAAGRQPGHRRRRSAHRHRPRARGSTCGALLAGGGACDVTVAFAPSAPGLRTGTLQVAGARWRRAAPASRRRRRRRCARAWSPT